MARRTVPISVQQIDPLSWFTGPYMPLVFAGLTLAWAGVGIGTTWSWSHPLLQLICAAICIGADLMIFAAARGGRTLSWAVGSLAVALSCFGMIISAFGYAGTPFTIEVWWASFAAALTMGSLGPYLPARQIALTCLAGTAIALPSSVLLLDPGVVGWGPVSVTVIIATPLVAGVVLTTVFSHHVVRRMQSLLEARSQTVVVPRDPVDREAETTERVRLAQLTARAVPFLEGVVARGEVRSVDRALAGQLARRLRDDLVTQANLSWLETAEAGSRLVVIDPLDLADKLRPAQRTALRGLIRALLAAPGVDHSSLMVELRRGRDGSTAVGVSMEAELPEGRRIMHLAPYLLTLRMTAEDLVWENDDFLRVSFEFPPERD